MLSNLAMPASYLLSRSHIERRLVYAHGVIRRLIGAAARLARLHFPLEYLMVTLAGDAWLSARVLWEPQGGSTSLFQLFLTAVNQDVSVAPVGLSSSFPPDARRGGGWGVNPVRLNKRFWLQI